MLLPTVATPVPAPLDDVAWEPRPRSHRSSKLPEEAGLLDEEGGADGVDSDPVATGRRVDWS